MTRSLARLWPRITEWLDINAYLTQLQRKQPGRSRPNFVPRVEGLEDRSMPSGLFFNHAPLGTSSTVTTLENSNFIFQATDFGFSDPNDTPSNNLLAVEITTLPSAGLLTNNGVPVLAGDFISVADISLNRLVYLPPLNGNGAAFASLTFQVQDNGGIYNGGVDTDPVAKTLTIDVTWVNQAPSFTASDPAAVNECADPVSIPNWATFSPGGGAEEAGQTATYIVTNVSNPDLFSEPPAVSADGTLTYTIAPYVNGTSTFDVQVRDSGGTANGGQDVSALLTNTVVVQDQLSPMTVTNTNNSGRGSLSDAIFRGNRSGLPLTINFDLPAGLQTIPGAFELTDDFTINGPGQDRLTIDGGGTYRVFDIAIGSTVNINNLIIANGLAAGRDPFGYGGGVYNAGRLNLYQVRFNRNQAVDGGAIYNTGTSTSNSFLTVENCIFTDNHASRNGGAINNFWVAHIQSDTMIGDNSANYGGGIYNGVVGRLTIDTGSQVSGNSAIGNPLTSRGGGIANEGWLTMSDAFLENNNSNNEGAGLYNRAIAFSEATLTNVSIQNNWTTDATTGKGGGIYLDSGTVTLVSGCTVAGNTSAVQGGGNGISWRPGSTLNDNVRLNTITDDEVRDQ